ncbi:MAG: hypothetical protein IJR87_08570 [Bacteroidaceae bacterium]|nr:hypothetical protein [Bacteroidaceae bacterium]
MNRRTFMGVAATSLMAATREGRAAAPSAATLKNAADGEPDVLHVRFLGTGAADWNGPDERGEHRRLSSILLDGTVLIDYTARAQDMLPDACRPTTIFYTHSHGDHYNPADALRLGIRDVYLSQTWYDIAYGEFRRASRELKLPMPQIHPLCIGSRVELGPLTITPLPANHATGHLMEQSLLYLVEKGTARMVYATDTGGIPATAARLAGIDAHSEGKAITALIMEATMGMEHEVDFRLFTHSSVRTVERTVQVLTQTGRYRPQPGQAVYLTHMARTLHGTQAELDRQLPSPLRAAYDGLEVEFR